ncbi:MAG: glycosyltransferase family 2 protein [Candidatus Nitronauta litoralis]|uniref:Glycosyltransferase family 2 protein n=1 Tax=Candidatus Nitronauta litoralis TaxID=2705533 RepID=A0A7T0G1E6_9BACT|nr:MAG: glycosyltransferase family 2 protein [Candidatus Nitronauta litoralis]
MKVSVIIPTLNEESSLSSTLDHLVSLEPDEIIISDGGSTDNTRKIAHRYPIHWVEGPPGRGCQMNSGAQKAQGDILLFLHADTILDRAGYCKMKSIMSEGTLVGGAYSLNISSPQKSLRLISHFANFRARTFNMAYGDQAIFVTVETFNKLNGFQPLPICEDLDFYKRLKSQGKVSILRHKANTSSRRWDYDGVFFCTLRNTLIAGAFLLGCSPRILSRWYPSRR